jgi:uncharacterized membrane protein YhaH (DUF805 family)
VGIALALLGGLFGTLGIILYGAYALAMFIPSLAVAVRRLHDINKSGWYYFGLYSDYWRNMHDTLALKATTVQTNMVPTLKITVLI